MWNEIKRKLFHLAALIYLAGIIYLPRRAYLTTLLVALAVVYALERRRLARPGLNDWFFRHFGGLFRPAERGRISGATWMLAGVAATVALAPDPRIAAAALLYLILGDGVASIAGMTLGGPRWPGSPKSLSGSAACFAVCVAAGAAALTPAYGWGGVIMGALAATALEAGIVPGDDNLTVPVGSAVALMLSYGLMPW